YLYQCLGACTGVSYIDSTELTVCHNRRIDQHRVFEGLPQRGHTSMGWFYGFKLHLVINEHGELVAFDLTAGHVHDTHMLAQLEEVVLGKLMGDKGYLSQQKQATLAEQGIDLVTAIRRNMRQLLMSLEDKVLLRKRSVIESVHNVLKNWANIDHTRQRSPDNFFVNLMAGLIAYCWKPEKPSVRIDAQENMLLNHTPRIA
ncbi:MAG: IS982 family transposase, partial [Limnobacter sp.]|nr:IS982 family transposase [Limnobacter sp.]